MSYQVLARKWRPRTFKEVVGQQHVLRALINALENERLHHAYLFTGTRGVGKTTLARILAKSLNCETGVTAEPCGECSACREIDEGRFVDLIEVDAASRTKVEETRELLENVQYAPTRGRYKVYLIDEVHMFSAHSFNALLKTLEEPPPHVKFLLATTDPQKLPVTILSRCLQFNLKHLSPEMIAGHLVHILDEEGIGHDPAAPMRIARAADGSMRDGLSLLDQAVAFGSGEVRDEEVQAMLGTIDQGYVVELLNALADADAAAVLQTIGRMAEHVPDYDGVLADAVSMLQRIALVQMVPGAANDAWPEREAIEDLAGRMKPEDVQLFYQIGLIGRRDLGLSPEPRGGFEMIMLRMLAFQPAEAGVTQIARSEPRAPAKAAAPAAPSAAAPESQPAQSVAATQASAPASTGGDEHGWAGMVEAMGLKGMLRELAANCLLTERSGDRMTLALSPALVNLRNDKLEQRLGEALEKHLGGPVKLTLEVAEAPGETPAQMQARLSEEKRQAAAAAINDDNVVKSLLDTFGGSVESDSIQPLE